MVWCGGIRGIIAALVFIGATSAQTLIVPPGPLYSGTPYSVIYVDPAKAGSTVAVVVDNGKLIDPETVVVVMQLDEHGVGFAPVTIPTSWNAAMFNAPGCGELARMVLPPPTPSPIH